MARSGVAITTEDPSTSVFSNPKKWRSGTCAKTYRVPRMVTGRRVAVHASVHLGKDLLGQPVMGAGRGERVEVRRDEQRARRKRVRVADAFASTVGGDELEEAGTDALKPALSRRDGARRSVRSRPEPPNIVRSSAAVTAFWPRHSRSRTTFASFLERVREVSLMAERLDNTNAMHAMQPRPPRGGCRKTPTLRCEHQPTLPCDANKIIAVRQSRWSTALSRTAALLQFTRDA